MHEELVHIVITFAGEGTRVHAGPIRQNRSLRPRGEGLAGERMLVVRVHEGAHSRRDMAAVKHDLRISMAPGDVHAEAVCLIVGIGGDASRPALREELLASQLPAVAGIVETQPYAH